MATSIRRYDWSTTRLGPMAGWSPTLRTSVALMLGSGHAMHLAWGPDRTLLYNDAYSVILADRHPGALGQPLSTAWADVWDEIEPLVEQVFAGETVRLESMPLVLRRHGQPEETWWNVSYSPIHDGSGAVAGLAGITVDATPMARAEGALRARNTEYRTLFETMGQGYAECELIRGADGHAIDLRYLALNPALERLSGLSVAQTLGRTAREVIPGIEESQFAMYERIVDGGVPERVEYEVATLGRWYETYVYPGAGDRFFTLYEDITVRKRAEAVLRESEERHAFLLELSDALRPLNDAMAIQRTAMEALGTHLRANRAFYGDAQADDDTLLIGPGYSHDTIALAGEVRFSDFALDMATWYRAGRTYVIDDVRTDDRFGDATKAQFDAIQVGAALGVPLVKEGRVRAIVSLHQTAPRRWTKSEITLAEEVAERTWAAVERARAETAQRESEARYRMLFDAIDEGFCLCERVPGDTIDYRYLVVNPAFDRQSGLDHPIGRTIREIVPGIDEATMQAYARVEATGRPEHFTTYVADLDQCFDVETIGTDRPGQIAMLFRNVTDRKHAEAALRESEERQRFLLRLSDALRPLDDPIAVQDVTTRMLGEHLQVDRCYYAEFDWLRDVLHIHHEYVRSAATSAIGRHPISAFHDLLQFSHEGRPLVCDDIAAHPVFSSEVAAYRERGTDGFILMPLVKQNVMVACLCVTMEVPRPWTSAEVALVAEVADRTWSAIDRARAEAALRASEEQQRLTVELVPAMLWWADAERQEIETNYRWKFYTGQDDASASDKGWLGTIHPDDLAATEAAFAHAFATGEPLEREQRIRQADDGYRWHLVRHVPVRDDAGVIRRWFGAAIDIHERKLTEQALHASEERLKTLVEGVPQLVWRAVDGGYWTWASPQWTHFTGQAEADSRAWGWLDPVHPDDRERVREVWAGAVERGEFHADYRLHHAAENRYRWFQTRATPVRDDAGAVIEWLGTSTDVDDLRALRERQDTLLAELQHRVRNILAVTRSIISRSDDGERTTDDYVAHLQGRIAALARTQVLLTRSAGTVIDLESLVRDELHVQTAAWDQVAITGPDVSLSPKTAEVLTLALHELVTNATKYGAFARPSGRLDIRWTVDLRDGQEWLLLDWTERGVPIVDAVPRRRGFGTELISRRIPYELKGHGSLELRAGGVESHIEFPLIEGESILQTDTGER